MAYRGRNTVIMDSIHGLTEVDPRLWRVLDTAELQRLRWIRQTGLAFLVYPGAEHSRFTHAVGTYGVARRLFRQLRTRSTHSGMFSPSQLDDELEQAFVTAALCHDLGHTAFSHVLEQLLLPKDLRTHEDCTFYLLKNGTVAKEIKNIECDLEQVEQLLQGIHWNNGLCKLLSGHIDVDRWDYLMRDSTAAGVVYGNYDLDWLINALSLHADSEGRPRLVLEAYRGLVPLRHFLAARRSMYQQVYWHTTVRGAERLLRAVFERAFDPARPAKYKEPTDADIPVCLRHVLKGERPTLGEFLETDDTAVLNALKYWAYRGRDPILGYLSRCLLMRRLFKEVRLPEIDDLSQFKEQVQSAVLDALSRQISADLPKIDADDREALGYFVLNDTCEFKSHSQLEGILFDTGDGKPKALDELSKRPEYEMTQALGPFTRTRMFVPADVIRTVEIALEKEKP